MTQMYGELRKKLALKMILLTLNIFTSKALKFLNPFIKTFRAL